MGTEISEVDLLNIKHLCEQVVEIQEYRDQLYNYLKNRMVAIAPNLTVLVGELVGARLISHAGSLMNLAKHPASTVQILGAEKALFKALKTKHDTPKYGLIYHAQLVGQSATALKVKIRRPPLYTKFCVTVHFILTFLTLSSKYTKLKKNRYKTYKKQSCQVTYFFSRAKCLVCWQPKPRWHAVWTPWVKTRRLQRNLVWSSG